MENITINNSEEPIVVINDRLLRVNFRATFKKKIAFEFQIHIKKDDFVICSYSNFIRHDVVTYQPGFYSFDYKINLPELRSGTYSLDIHFAEAYVGWFASNANQIDLLIVNDKHNVFINSEQYNWWGADLLTGDFSYSKKIDVF